MRFLHFLEGLRNPVCDFLFSLITHIGEETVFLAVAILFFWCINKREGYYILITGLIGTLVNQFLKMLCRIPRPWERGTGLTYVESAFEEAKGYSFPSGHTQNTAGTFGVIGAYSKKKWLRITTVVIIVLVGFSRMYLGVHTPADVLVSLAVAAVLVVGFYPLFTDERRFHRAMPYIIAASAILAIGFAVYVSLIDPSEVLAHNYKSSRDNAATLLGCFFGLCVVYPLDRFVIKFETGGVWYSQLIKLVLGFGLVMGVKAGLSAPLEALVGIFTDTPRLVARAIRYFLVVLTAGVFWPLSFGFFARLRISFLDNFTDWLKSKLTKTQHAPASIEEKDN